jgi:hypothetical protein
MPSLGRNLPRSVGDGRELDLVVLPLLVLPQITSFAYVGALAGGAVAAAD